MKGFVGPKLPKIHFFMFFLFDLGVIISDKDLVGSLPGPNGWEPEDDTWIETWLALAMTNPPATTSPDHRPNEGGTKRKAAAEGKEDDVTDSAAGVVRSVSSIHDHPANHLQWLQSSDNTPDH